MSGAPFRLRTRLWYSHCSIVLRLFQYLIADHTDNFVLHGFVSIGGELQPDLEQGVPDALGGVKVVAGFQWLLSFWNS